MGHLTTIVEAATPPSLAGDPIEIAVPNRPKLSRSEAKALIEKVQQVFAGGSSLEDEYFRDREADKW